MFIAKELGLTLEKALEMSDLEFRMWVAYYRLEAKDRERVNRGRRRNSR